MRRSINPSVLITSWPPPNGNHGDFNRERFKTWLNYIIITHDIPNRAFTNTSQKYYISHQTLKAIMNCERNLTVPTVLKIASILAKHTPRNYLSLKREAIANTKPYSRDI